MCTCNINVFKFFGLTRTCMHLKGGLNRKRLGKIENLILTCGLLFFIWWNLFPLLSPTPAAPTPCPKPLHEPNLPSESGRSFTPIFFFLHLKKIMLVCFLYKCFKTSSHKTE